MKFLILDQTTVDHDPVVYSLGTLLARDRHQVKCIGYSKSGETTEQAVSKNFSIIRVDRGQWTWFPRILRGFVRYYKYTYFCKNYGQSFKPDVILAFNYDTLLVGAIVKRITSSRLVYYCTEYTPKPNVRDYLIGWGFVKTMQKYWLRYVDYFVSVDEQRAIRQSQEWKIEDPVVIHNAPLYNPIIEEYSRNNIKKVCEPVKMVYAGRISTRNCIDNLLSALNQVSCSIILDFFGSISKEFVAEFEEGLKKLASRENVKIQYGGLVPYYDLEKLLPAYDVGIVLYSGEDPNSAMSAPAKLFEYMKAGLAILTTNQPGQSKIIRESECGWIIEPRDVTALTLAIEDIAISLDEVKRARISSLESFKHKFCYERQIVPFSQWLKTINLIVC